MCVFELEFESRPGMGMFGAARQKRGGRGGLQTCWHLRSAEEKAPGQAASMPAILSSSFHTREARASETNRRSAGLLR
jgi:hypothetical protein